jgi:hypothetical protein
MAHDAASLPAGQTTASAWGKRWDELLSNIVGLLPAGVVSVVIWLRTPPAACAPHGFHGNGEAGADIVVDLHDPAWPVIRHVGASLATHGRWYITETRAFFGPRAATWDTTFGRDLPAYAAAIAEANVPEGGHVIDVGCGTGQALPALRQAVGPQGTVVALDLTPEMLVQARARATPRTPHSSSPTPATSPSVTLPSTWCSRLA